MQSAITAILTLLLWMGSMFSMGAAQCKDGICRINPPTVTPNLSLRSLREAVVRITVCTDRSTGYGSGTIVDVQGVLDQRLPDSAWCTIISCAHLFDTTEATIRVTFANGRRVSARLVQLDRESDLSVLIARKPEGVPQLVVAEMATRAGEPVVKFGFDSSGRLRCVSASVLGYARTARSPQYDTLVLSRRSYPGESGGPIFNHQGELTGVIWGTDATRTMGTYCGRLRRFLRKIASRLRQRLTHPRPGNGKAAIDPGLREPDNRQRSNRFDDPDQGIDVLRDSLGRMRGLLDRQSLDLRERLQQQKREFQTSLDMVGSDLKNIRRHLENVSGSNPFFSRRDLLLTAVLGALGISAPPTAAMIALKVLLWIRRRRKARSSVSFLPREKGDHPELNDQYAKQLNALMQTYGGRSTAQDATLGRTYDQELASASQSSDGAIASFASRLRRRAHDAFDRIHAPEPLPAEPSASSHS